MKFLFAIFCILFFSAEEFAVQHPLPFSYAEGQTESRTEVRDPCIVRDGERYYLVFTMWPFRNREEERLNEPNQGGSPGIAMYSSADLKDWRFENWLVKADELPEDCPYKNRFWAPEIHKIGGKFYFVFTADNWIRGDYNAPGTWGTAGYAFIGVAENITGPYEHITWVEGGPCDMSLFGDENGKIYAVSPKYHVYVREIDLSRLAEGKIAWVGEEVLAVKCENEDAGLSDDPDYLEGPWMEKIGETYCLFHAAIYKYPEQNRRHEYWTQAAYADHPLGPWRKDPRVKIFQGGHLAVFDGPDGEKWFSYRHEAGVAEMQGKLCAEPISSAISSPAENPILWTDVPDMAIIRVGDTYYMLSTTMHLSPGMPIMKSKNLADWEIIGYVYDRLEDCDAMNLRNGKNAYGAGSWAGSLRFHDGIFYATTFSGTTGRTYVFTTKDIENGPWKKASFTPAFHDHTLFFDDDGRVYMLHGGGDLRLTELTADASAIMPGGVDEIVIRDASRVAGEPIGLPAEGSQMFKHDGKYYVSNIAWPRDGMRTQILHRADAITGPYEGRVILRDRGIAQGSLIDTPDGQWYAYLFQDRGAVGRVPFLVPVKWEAGWPILGDSGRVPAQLNIPRKTPGAENLVASDEFHHEKLPLVWQWNHHPDDRFWSLTARPGWLRLTAGHIAESLPEARNTLTQRTFGPECSAVTLLDTSGMKDGDCAGIAAFQKRYGFVGVKMEAGVKTLVMADTDDETRIPLDTHLIHLKVACDFRDLKDEARFFWSTDGETWTQIGETLKMTYTLPHFMGYRFALFHFATRETGGFTDFDYFHVFHRTHIPLIPQNSLILN